MSRDPNELNSFSDGSQPTRTSLSFASDLSSAESAAHTTVSAGAASHPTPTPFVQSLPGYDIRRFLGEGGMGQVFLAWDLRHKREVAVKLFRLGDHTPADLAERFFREAEVLKHLDHPNVVRVYEAGETNGFAYYTMRVVPDGSLVRQVKAIRSSVRRAVEFMQKVAAAVHYVHERGVLHRDLKPGNILVDEGEPLIVDFGLARYDDGHTPTSGGGLFGTPAYMAPEVVQGGPKACSERSDVWALGVTLYELLAGKRPFPGDRYDPALFHGIRTQAPPPFAASPAALPDLDDRLESICLKCLAKLPNRRYATAAALAEDLQLWLEGNPPLAVGETGVRVAAEEPQTDVGNDTTATATAEAAPKKRKWGRLAAAVGLIGLAVLAAVLMLLPPKKKTVAERLLKPGDFVEFIGETGLPKEHVGPLGKFDGSVSLALDDRCELGTGKLYFHELFNEALPFPHRLEADLAVNVWENATLAGLYAGEKRHVHQTGAPLHVAFWNFFGAGDRDPNNNRVLLNNLAVVGPGKSAVPDGGLNANRLTSLIPLPDERKKLPPDAPQPHDRPGPPHHMTIDIHSTEMTATRDNQPCGRSAVPNGLFEGLLALDGVQLDRPTFGTGYGLFVANGSALFWNVRVTRLPDSFVPIPE